LYVAVLLGTTNRCVLAAANRATFSPFRPPVT
jgi:hypothetical protein